MIKRFKSRHLGLSSFQSNSNFEIPEGIKSLISSLCPPSVLFKQYFSLMDFSNSASCNIFDNLFSLTELVSHIKNLKLKSSPGLDRIDYKMICLLPNQYLPILLDIFNSIFKEGAFPDSWQHSIVFLLPKNSPGKFRSISLTSCLFKLMEKLIHSRIKWWIEKNKLLPSRQFGFRKRKSCHDNLGILLSDIYNGFG